MRIVTKNLKNTLKQHGYKLTRQRRAVLNILAHSHDHLTPASIYEKVHQDYPEIGFTTIYRTLEILSRLNLICELHAGGSCHSYTIGTMEHHHHLICSNCGTVIGFTDCKLGDVERTLSRQTGFKINDHLLEFVGLCQSCQKRGA